MVQHVPSAQFGQASGVRDIVNVDLSVVVVSWTP